MGVTDHSSTTGIDLGGCRLLLVAPHPDDESLALGGLIQQAMRQGAHVTLLQVTDGDNNPWPQRWLERRWRIGPPERKRWGARRVDEVRQAMQCLGLPAAALQRLHWPDLGAGARLLDDGAAAVAAFAEVVRLAAPDVVALPDLADRHPDHGACHVLVRLALAKLSLCPTYLTYRVHGGDGHVGAPCVVVLDADMREAKRRAVLAHGTQVALARRRLLAMVGPSETLHRLQPPECAHHDVPPRCMALPWQPPRCLHPWLQLSVAHGGGSHVWAWRHAPLQRSGGDWQLTLPDDIRSWPVFARLALRRTTPWIFDHWGWCDLTAVALARQAGK